MYPRDFSNFRAFSGFTGADVVAAIAELNTRLSIPTSLGAAGILVTVIPDSFAQ
jgi:hypothetical protein